MNGSVNHTYRADGIYRPLYPPVPPWSSTDTGSSDVTCLDASPDQPPRHRGTKLGCTHRIEYDTLPPKFPMRDTILGSTSLKHLYRGAWFYPPQRMQIPDGTMYDHDSSSFRRWPRGGYGDFDERETYGMMIYPFRHRSPHEARETTGEILPLPNLFAWTKYSAGNDGAWGR